MTELLLIFQLRCKHVYIGILVLGMVNYVVQLRVMSLLGWCLHGGLAYGAALRTVWKWGVDILHRWQ